MKLDYPANEYFLAAKDAIVSLSNLYNTEFLFIISNVVYLGVIYISHPLPPGGGVNEKIVMRGEKN